MPLLSVSNATVTELFRGSARFARPSTNKGVGWIATANGNAIIQNQTYKDGDVVTVVRWTNYMEVDGLNGRILPGLPILRKANSVYFKTSSTTTRGDRYKAPFVFQFDSAECAEKFEKCWLKLNVIAPGKEEDAKKKARSSSSSNNKKLPLQDTTNVASTSVQKRKAIPMMDGPLLKKVKVKDTDHSLKVTGGGGDVPALMDGRADDDDDNDGISDPGVVSTFNTVGLMPKEVNVNGKLRVIVKAKRSILKSIAEQSSDEDNDSINDDDDEKSVGSNEDNSNDSNDDDGSSNDDDDHSNDDDSSNDSSSGEDVIIDEEDAPQSQNWMTAFASY
jgi:hypothetical protein